MRHLALIKIKNSEFDYARYGLKNNYFSIDITNSFNYSKNVGVTQYALLDGTVRIDNISREPANFTLQGLLGEVRGGNTSDAFVYATVEKNRLQNQMDLLEAIRDQATFIDIITEERAYKNCIITGINFGKNRSGQIDALLNIREIIVFGDEINVTPNITENGMSDYDQGLILDFFAFQNMTNDEGLVNEIYRVITSSTLSNPFIITMGPIDSNPDVVIPSYSLIKKTTTKSLPTIAGASIIAADTNKLLTSATGAEIITGNIAGGNYLHLTFPPKQKNENLYATQITKNPLGQYDYVSVPSTYVHIRLLNNNETLYSVQKGEILKSPAYSDIVNGVHYLNTAGSNSDIIATDKYGLCFIRKQRYNTYIALPNLLGNESRGYLYCATFEKTVDSTTKLYPMLVYIQPRAWQKIKYELKQAWSRSAYFKEKTLVI